MPKEITKALETDQVRYVNIAAMDRPTPHTCCMQAVFPQPFIRCDPDTPSLQLPSLRALEDQLGLAIRSDFLDSLSRSGGIETSIRAGHCRRTTHGGSAAQNRPRAQKSDEHGALIGVIAANSGDARDTDERPGESRG